jgi:hypothetical protein
VPSLPIPPPVYPRQGPLGLSDAATNIEFLADHLDLESQSPAQEASKRGPGHCISLLGFLFFFFVGLAFLLYYGIKKHDVNTGIGIMGTLLTVYSMLDIAVQWWFKRRAVRCEGCYKI